jgi:ABC-type multidrug transport system ATPase subunit
MSTFAQASQKLNVLSMIIFDQVTIKYPNETIFSNYSIVINRGEKVVFTGPSGVGKTTILNAIMGFVKPVSGSILVDNQPVDASHIRSIRKHIGWLPQELSFDIKSCRQLALFPFSYKQNHKQLPTTNELHEMMKSLLLDPQLLDKNLDEISGGQKQRILLASVLLLKKPLVLLDEPTSALDAESTKALLSFILNNPDTTVISCSHDPLWIENMNRRFPLINENK